MNIQSTIRYASVIAMAICALVWVSSPVWAQDFLPGGRVLLDAHNCYPYQGKWADRIDRALSTGVPVAIEQDLVWHEDPESGEFKSIVSHGSPFTGEEPTLDEYFFERIRPIVEKALKDGNDGSWPLVTLNIDYKNNSIAHVEAAEAVFKKYADWLCSAEKTDDPDKVMPLDVKPVLVLVGDGLNQEEVYATQLPVGKRILAFGAVQPNSLNDRDISRTQRQERDATIAPNLLVSKAATNYRRWWNNPWRIVEQGGQRRAGAWDERDAARLKALVDHAHKMGYWIRFYTLNGHDRHNDNGWSTGYNFGSLKNAQLRWNAALKAGVDFVATDMYEEFSKTQHAFSKKEGKKK